MEAESQTIYAERESGALLVRSETEAAASSASASDWEMTAQRRLAGLPVELDVRVPLPNFRVSDLLALAPGRVLATEWASTEDLPLLCGDVQLVWTEFEVVEQTLAVRVTRLV